MVRAIYEIYTDTNQFLLDGTGSRNVQTIDDVERFFYFRDGVTPLPFVVHCNKNSRVLIEAAQLAVYGADGLREGLSGIVSPIQIIMTALNDATPDNKATFGIPLFRFNQWIEVNKEVPPEWFPDLEGYRPKLSTLIAAYDALNIQDIYKEKEFSYRVLLRLRCAGIYKDGELI